MAQLVYFIRAGADGPIKIGISVDPLVRLRDMQVAHHVELFLLGTVYGGERFESRLHDRFAAHRIRGEWFEPVGALLDLIAGYGFADVVGPMPSMAPLVIADPISDVCDSCGWPTQAELVERGIRRCWACLKEVPESPDSETAASPANSDFSRRLPESNRWKVPDGLAQPCGSAVDGDPSPVTPSHAARVPA